MSYVDQQYQKQPPQRGGGGGGQHQQQNYGNQQDQQGGGVVSKAPVMRISGAPQFIVPPTPKPEKEGGKQWNIDKLRETDGIVPPQYGSNQFASQRGMTGFGTARDVGGKHLHRFWEALGPNECVGLDQSEFQFGGNISGAQAQARQQQFGQQPGQGQGQGQQQQYQQQQQYGQQQY